MSPSHSTMFEHEDIISNCIYQIADLTCANSALPGEFALYETIDLPYDIVKAVSLNSFKRILATVCF